jgi:hypothetical protein
MKKLLLLLVALAPVVSTSAQATVPTVGLQSFAFAFAPGAGRGTSSGALPPGSGAQPVPLDCTYIFDKAITDLQSGAKKLSTPYSTLLIGESALAEAPSSISGSNGGGFGTFGGDAALSAGKIKGTSHIAAPGATARKDLAFTISKVGDKPKISWSHQGKSYSGNLDNCTSGYWTASSSTSSIAIKMDVFVPVVPE